MARPDAATLRKLAAQGKAMRNAKGEPAFYIRNGTDLGNAIHRVGSGGASHNAIRKHIIKRAKALGLSSRIPDNWAADGSLKSGGGSPSSSGSSQSGSPSSSSKAYDPDNDGDNDATPAGDTDHSHWTPGGRQLKPVPGKPMSTKAQKAARIFAMNAAKKKKAA